MKINRTKSGDFYHYLNVDNVIVRTDWRESYVENGDVWGGTGDSLGRLGYALFPFDEDRELLIKSIKSYYSYVRTSPETGWHWYVSRYPRGEKYAVRGNSRDHVLKSMVSLLYNGEEEFVKDYVKNRAKRPCIDHPFTPDQKILFKAMFSNFWSWVFVLFSIFQMFFRRLGIGFFRLLTFRHIGMVRYNAKEFIEDRPVPKNKWAAFVSKKQLIFPQYALLYGAYAMHGLKSKSAGRTVRFLHRQFIDKGNLALKALCGQKITQEELDNHVPIIGNRWSTRLDWTCDRTVKLYEGDNTDNVYEAFLYALMENQEKYGKWNALGKRDSLTMEDI